MTKKEFEIEYNKIFEKAMAMSEKTRREGLLSLDDCIDEEKLYQRDIMELGLRLTYDGTDLTIIDNILTNIIDQETDNQKKLLKTVQKNAVLMIHQGYSRGIFAIALNSLVDVCYEDALKIYEEKNNFKKALSPDEINTEEKPPEENSDGKQTDPSEELFNLAVSYIKGDGVEQNFTEADELFRKYLEIKKAYCGEEHIFIATNYYIIAGLFREYEEYEKAISYYEDALSIYKKISDEKSQDITDTLCCLGICYEAVADYEKAISYFKETVAADEIINGKDNENTAVYYNQISVCYVKSGDYKNALIYSEKALAIREKIFGTEDSNTAHVYYKIAEIYYLQEDYKNALAYYEKSYKAYEKTKGKEDDITNTSYFGIAACYEEMKEYEKALAYYKDTLTVYENIFGKDNTSTALTCFCIASCYYNLEDYEKALEYDLEALSIREKICDESAPELSVSYNNVGSNYRSLSKFDEALKYHLKALELRKKHCEIKDYIAFSYCGVGKDYEGKGDKENAALYFQEALSIYESLEGFESEKENTRQAVERNKK